MSALFSFSKIFPLLAFFVFQNSAHSSFYEPFSLGSCESVFGGRSAPAKSGSSVRVSDSLKDTDRQTHPFVGVMFQNLLPLNHSADGKTPLQMVGDQVKRLKGFASALFMGSVYPQSVLEHDALDGDKRTYPNTGYYWPQSFGGVDPTLGTKTDYVRTVQAARANGLEVIQDIGMTYLGYPPQNEHQLVHYKRILEMQGIPYPEGMDYKETAHFMGGWRSISDPTYFMKSEDPATLKQAFILYETDQDPSLADFRWAMKTIQEGELFGLKRINTDNPKILEQLIQDHLWYIRDAKVTSFRLDAAKHMRPATIRQIISRFTREVRTHIGPNVRPSFFLEFWTQKYRNMRYFLNEIGKKIEQMYFYDYPLGVAIRSAIVMRDGQFEGLSGFEGLKDILNKRREYRIKMQQLVPVWIDHDFLVPVYNGSERSVGQLAAGYTVAYMMSANAPHVYNGFEKPDFWRDPQPPSGQFVEPARNPINDLVDTNSKAFQVLQSLVSQFGTPLNRDVLAQSEDVFLNSVSRDHVVIERRLDHLGHKIVARISKNSDPGHEPRGTLVWEYITQDISVRIFTEDYAPRTSE